MPVLKHFDAWGFKAKQGGSIGIVIAMKWYEPLTNTTEDILAARRAEAFELEWYVILLFSLILPTYVLPEIIIKY